MSEYILRALAAMAVLAILVGPTGSVAVWRRMGYYGDAASHAALLGVALSLLLNLPIFIGTGLIAIAFALYLAGLSSGEQSVDGLLGVMAHGSLALALVILAMSPGGQINLEGYLFGDVLTISRKDLLYFSIAALIILLIMLWRWNKLIYCTLNEEMAAAHGLNPKQEMRIFTLLLALATALGIQLVGALLMGAFLIIPAMSARRFARSPESMAILASLIALISGGGGFALSYYFDLPTAPAMVTMAVFVFFLAQFRKFQ